MERIRLQVSDFVLEGKFSHTLQELSDAGYTFENDRFALANNFGFTQTGMIIYYNSYEIGPNIM